MIKFTVSSADLSSRFQAIGRVISNKNTFPLLECFLIDLNNGVMNITASDGETTLRTNLTLEGASDNLRIAINAKTIGDALKEIPEQPLTFEIEEETGHISIKYLNGEYTMTGQPAAEYPEPQLPADDAATLKLKTSSLLTGLNRALSATAEDELRPVMNGVCFDRKENSLNIVATDGHRLVLHTCKNLETGTPAQFIVPTKPATLLKSLLSKTDDDTQIKFDGRNALIEMPEYRISCRLIDGKYPKYDSVIPKDNPNKMIIDRNALISALRRVTVFTNVADSSLVKLQINMNELTMSTQYIDYSCSAKEKLACEYGGMPLNIGFKGSSLLEILNNLNCDDVVFELGDPSRAGIIVPAEQAENEEVLMLIMPMMLND